MITAGELRKLIDGKSDDENIPLYCRYNEVCNDTVFARFDDLSTTRPDGALNDPGDPPGLYLTLSLVPGEN